MPHVTPRTTDEVSVAAYRHALSLIAGMYERYREEDPDADPIDQFRRFYTEQVATKPMNEELMANLFYAALYERATGAGPVVVP
jgi:DNA-binding SARP family transcriptional activator